MPTRSDVKRAGLTIADLSEITHIPYQRIYRAMVQRNGKLTDSELDAIKAAIARRWVHQLVAVA